MKRRLAAPPTKNTRLLLRRARPSPVTGGGFFLSAARMLRQIRCKRSCGNVFIFESCAVGMTQFCKKYHLKHHRKSATRAILFMNKNNNLQREMPFFKALAAPKYAPNYAIDSFRNYRDAVVWCWENRGAGSGDEDMDQAIAARLLGVNKGLFNRAVKRDSKGPVNLDYNVVPEFEALCGWNAITQWQARKKRVTLLEEMQALLGQQQDRRTEACA